MGIGNQRNHRDNEEKIGLNRKTPERSSGVLGPVGQRKPKTHAASGSEQLDGMRLHQSRQGISAQMADQSPKQMPMFLAVVTS